MVTANLPSLEFPIFIPFPIMAATRGGTEIYIFQISITQIQLVHLGTIFD